jgi:ABC-type multidrug transport system fused ATPase/permease subunit
MRVINGIPLGSSLLLPVCTVNSVQTLKAGQSGSGKSSVLRLLQRNYEPNAGTVRLDGVDISQLNTAWLRGQIGVVAQEPVLFSGTVEENIRAGRKGISQDAVIVAAQLADVRNPNPNYNYNPNV